MSVERRYGRSGRAPGPYSRGSAPRHANHPGGRWGATRCRGRPCTRSAAVEGHATLSMFVLGEPCPARACRSASVSGGSSASWLPTWGSGVPIRTHRQERRDHGVGRHLGPGERGRQAGHEPEPFGQLRLRLRRRDVVDERGRGREVGRARVHAVRLHGDRPAAAHRLAGDRGDADVDCVENAAPPTSGGIAAAVSRIIATRPWRNAVRMASTDASTVVDVELVGRRGRRGCRVSVCRRRPRRWPGAAPVRRARRRPAAG